MQVLRRAAVLIVLSLSLGISAAHATPARPPYGSKVPTLSFLDRIEPWWNLVTRVLSKAGCSINPLGLCGVTPATQVPTTDAGCTIDPWGRCEVSLSRQSPEADAGCTIDPLGRCPGH